MPDETDRAASPPAAAALVKRLLDERLSRTRSTFILDHFCRLVREAGVPVDRMGLSLRQLHPQLIARTLRWDVETGGAVEVPRDFSVVDDAGYRASPFFVLNEGGGEVRRRLCDPDCPDDFPILAELRARGFTDYRVAPLPFSGRVMNMVTLATRQAGGFRDEQLALFDACMPALATVVELDQMRRTGRTLLATYIGPRTAERVWEGTIRRGQGERVYAIVYICDLRGFTDLAARQPLDETIELLNAYFDAMGGAVERHGGEILKFMGDALLAIFPCDRTAERNCRMAAEALAAAEEGLAALAALSADRESRGLPVLRAGAALSVGDVLYGNIGVADRLDFTVIGPAVNLAARMQALCSELRSDLLLSEEVCRRLPRPTRSRGRHRLKGVAEPVEVFVPLPAEE